MNNYPLAASMVLVCHPSGTKVVQHSQQLVDLAALAEVSLDELESVHLSALLISDQTACSYSAVLWVAQQLVVESVPVDQLTTHTLLSRLALLHSRRRLS